MKFAIESNYNRRPCSKPFGYELSLDIKWRILVESWEILVEARELINNSKNNLSVAV